MLGMYLLYGYICMSVCRKMNGMGVVRRCIQRGQGYRNSGDKKRNLVLDFGDDEKKWM